MMMMMMIMMMMIMMLKFVEHKFFVRKILTATFQGKGLRDLH